MKLIDADEFIKKFRYSEAETDDEKNMCAAVRRLIREEPVAFDKEKVIEELEQLKLDGACNHEDCASCKHLDKCWDGEMEGEHTADIAIEIVKRGGIDD